MAINRAPSSVTTPPSTAPNSPSAPTTQVISTDPLANTPAVVVPSGLSSFSGGSLGANDADGMINRVQVPARAPIFFKGTPTFEGVALREDVLADRYNGVAAKDFGSTNVKVPTQDGGERIFQVHDMLYALGNGKVGMHRIAVSDHDAAANKEMDDFLRKKMKLRPEDPIFALVAYVHPEQHTGTIMELGTQMLKPEMGNTHLGSYHGLGRTTNAPETYHSKTWEVDGYPANVQIISMAGTDQATLNRNLGAVDAVLNDGVKFPPDYKDDPFRTVDLNTTLMFYRDWLKDEPYLRDDSSWQTYCAEHKTIVTNVGLNVPHNLDAFKEIFGDAEGSALWDQFKARFEKATRRAFAASDETRFEPLWKKEGIKPEQLRPPTKVQYDAYQAARFDGTLRSGTYVGYEPLPVGRSLAWRPETTADLVKNFVETYSPFREVGGVVAAASVLAFKDKVMQRMGLTEDDFAKLAMPVLQELLAAEALARAPATDFAGLNAWTQKTTAAVYVALGGKPADFAAGGVVDPKRMGFARSLMAKVPTVTAQLPKLANTTAEDRNDLATGWMRKAMQDDLAAARAQMVSDPGKTEYYSPPAVTNRVVNGLVDSNRFVKIQTVATAVDALEVQRDPADEPSPLNVGP
jgi:hypothetical protein